MKIAVVIPCYKARETVLDVIGRVPADVSTIVCIDDGCPHETGKWIEEACADPRVHVAYNVENGGVGAAVLHGYRVAFEAGADICVKIDSDGQMDPTLIGNFIRPIVLGFADYTKGNRFYSPEHVRSMPWVRLVGNAGLTFVTKASSGYWRLNDPTNGFTALHRSAYEMLPTDKIERRYFFESDMLFWLNTVSAVVVDVPMYAVYGTETSHLNPTRELFAFARKNTRNFFRRMYYCYLIRNFSIATIEFGLSVLLLLFSSVFGAINWWHYRTIQEMAPTGTVVLTALTAILGVQLGLGFLAYDFANEPKTPLQKLFGRLL